MKINDYHTKKSYHLKRTINTCITLIFYIIISYALTSSSLWAQESSQKAKFPKENEEFLASGSECEKKLFQSLYGIYDPEIDINIADLGIIELVECNEQTNTNTVTIILTSPFCPYVKDLVADIKKQSKTLYPNREAKVRIDTEIRWNLSRLSPKARKQFLDVPE